jgi:hypothetical protein
LIDGEGAVYVPSGLLDSYVANWPNTINFQAIS